MHTIILRFGDILDSIEVNGQRFGGAGGHNTATVNLAQNEKVMSIQYSAAKNSYKDKAYCNFTIHTNQRAWGPYNTNADHCYMTIGSYSRHISDGNFLEFMQQNARTNSHDFIEFTS